MQIRMRALVGWTIAAVAACSVAPVTYTPIGDSSSPPPSPTIDAGTPSPSPTIDAGPPPPMPDAGTPPITPDAGVPIDAPPAAQCGNGVLDPDEEVDPPRSPVSSVPVSDQTCRFDFSAINQLFCDSACGIWGAGDGCQQEDADAFCKLKTGDPTSVAITFSVAEAISAPGICCPSVAPDDVGCTPLRVFDDRGVPLLVSIDNASLLDSHGPGQVITNVACGEPGP